jgi:ATP synthase F1 complex assembly factor 1
MTPHDRDAIAKIWTAYHTSHPTLSSSFLSAFLPTSNYTTMLETAKQNPFFVLPLPRPATSDSEVGEVLTDSYEMFYVQWLFHPTSGEAMPPSPDSEPMKLPLTSSIIFTPLEEFKKSGEWAQPYLVMTHYPEMANSHDLVLMRGEITPVAAGGPVGSDANPGFLLSQQQAQLLALALQKFYCTGIELPGEGTQGKAERLRRAEALRGFREKPEEWDWKGLVDMAYGGIV